MHHKNLPDNSFITEILLCWRLMWEEYIPNINYIKVHKNKAEDALNRLPLMKSDIIESDITR